MQLCISTTIYQKLCSYLSFLAHTNFREKLIQKMTSILKTDNCPNVTDWCKRICFYKLFKQCVVKFVIYQSTQE